jgi:competence protein ComEA
MGQAYDKGEIMGKSITTLVLGLLSGLIITGILLLFIAPRKNYPVELQPAPSPSSIRVHVAGEVTQPGVYDLHRNSIVQDAIEAAGGELPDANLDRVNLAAEIEDGMYLFIPPQTVEETPSDPPPPGQAAVEGLVNINTAPASELERLPGIGPALALKIIEFREANGLFQIPEDLLNVSGIGPSKMEEISPWITCY